MINLSVLQSYLDNYLNFDKKLSVEKIDPYMSNGLMVKGKGEIKKVGFGVSASIALFEKAKKENCDAIVVHHSFNFPSYNRYDRIFQNRIGFLIKNEISLFGYHFLLDAHPEIGNNVEILKFIGIKPVDQFLLKSDPWGWVGEDKIGLDINDVIKRLKPKLSSLAIIYDFGPKKIKRVAVVSGKGAPVPNSMEDLISQSIDLFITGEAHEWNKELFQESRINFLAGGHYHTEVFGITAIMRMIEKKFPGVKTAWLDLPNEV